MISSIKLWIVFMIRLLFVSPRIFFLIIWEYCILNFVFWKKKIISVWFKNTILQWPNEHGFFYTAVEVFYRELYSKLKWSQHILDLGGYLWESAVWLSLYNTKVTVVEPNPSNFKFLKENVKWYPNIEALDGAIVYQSDIQLYHQGWDFSAWWNITDKKTSVPIKSIDIDTIRSSDIDWIKMDIEGGEYDIINFLKTEKWLQLKKWYIEFHKIIDNANTIKEYTNYLLLHNYTLEFEDINGNTIDDNTFYTKHIAVLYFYK